MGVLTGTFLAGGTWATVCCDILSNARPPKVQQNVLGSFVLTHVSSHWHGVCKLEYSRSTTYWYHKLMPSAKTLVISRWWVILAEQHSTLDRKGCLGLVHGGCTCQWRVLSLFHFEVVGLENRGAQRLWHSRVGNFQIPISKEGMSGV